MASAHRHSVWGALALVLIGCGGGDDGIETGPAPIAPCAPGDRILEDGSCLAPGVPPDGCPSGFEHDGSAGCVAVVPPEPCPDGLVAMLGETECRPVAPCPTGPFPEVPGGGIVHYVDGAYGGGNSDGSQAAPWVTLQAAVGAAPPGAVIAIAAGSYHEGVTLQKPLTLWGVCPERAQLVGPTDGAAVLVRDGASGSVVRGLEVTGPMPWPPIAVSGSEDVLIQEVWIHDSTTCGIYADTDLGPTSIIVRDVLIERTPDIGIQVKGARADIERASIRYISPGQVAGRGRGINVEAQQASSQPGQASIRQTIIERIDEVGIFVGGSQVDVAATLLRDLGQQSTVAEDGQAVSVESLLFRGSATLDGLVVERARGPTVVASGADLALTNTTIRDVLADAVDGRGGTGVQFQDDPALAADSRSSGTVSATLIERAQFLGLVVMGSAVTAERLVVRDTLPSPVGQTHGTGVVAQWGPDTNEWSWLELGWSRIEGGHTVGLAVLESSAWIHDVHIRDTQPSAADGLYGDGLVVASVQAVGHTDVANVVVQDCARVGLGNFSSSVSLAQSQIICNAVDLDAESNQGAYSFDDLGGNQCGCGSEPEACKIISTGIEPPPAPEL